MKKKPLNIFLSSIHQNAGKTMVSLGLYKVFKARKIKTAFMKPVGQQVVSVGASSVDKDSYLIGEVFKMGRKLQKMSPVTIGRGFTEKYVFNPDRTKFFCAIKRSYDYLIKGKDAIIVEGTGHAGVGAVIDASNADVAEFLGSKVIIISEGGIGKSIDEIVLNKALFDLKNIEIVGIIVNKVLPEKYEKIKRTIKRGLENKGIRLLGVIPHQPLLSSPTVEQLKKPLNLEILCGKENINRRVKHVIVAAMEPHNMIYHLKDGTLVCTSGDRIDNILLAVSSHLVRDGRRFQIAGIILTGGLTPSAEIINLLEKSEIPVFVTPEDTYTVAAKYENYICKIQKTDKDKIEEAARLVTKYVDVDAIVRGFEGESA